MKYKSILFSPWLLQSPRFSVHGFRKSTFESEDSCCRKRKHKPEGFFPSEPYNMNTSKCPLRAEAVLSRNAYGDSRDYSPCLFSRALKVLGFRVFRV